MKAQRSIKLSRLFAACAIATWMLGCAQITHRAIPEFAITSDPAGPPLVGFGAEMNPYLYCKPNWGDNGGAVNETNVKLLEAKVIALHPQHVRIFCLLDWFTDAGDPQIAKGDPRMRESFIRTVRLAQRAGATVNLTLWYNFWKTPEKSAADFADVLRDLIDREHLTAIRYVTLGNEVNSDEYKIDMEIYNRTYLALGREFKRAGLTERVQIVSGDLVSTHQEIWFADLGKNLCAISGGYSMHMYWDYWNTPKLQWRISSVQRVALTLPTEQQRPLFITEFGVRGHLDPGEKEPGRFVDGTLISDTTIQATQCAWAMIEALNHGFVATSQWECFDAWYDYYMQYGLIGGVKTGWKLRPAYHMLQLFTHTTQPGWRAMQITGSTNNISIAATRAPDGGLAIYVLNRSEKPIDLRLGSPKLQKFYVTGWNVDGAGRLSKQGMVRADRLGTIEQSVPGLCLFALTTTQPRF